MSPAVNDTLFLELFIVFCTAAAVQVFYYSWFYLAVSVKRKERENTPAMPVSVIICARNEAENLKKFLPSVLEQDYPSFEVIVVNDCSEDSSDDVLGEFLLKYPHLRISPITKDTRFTHNKKFAQFIGIKAAVNEILLFTDADCEPSSKNWIRMMASGFEKDTEFVLGYGGYFPGKGMLNKYIRYDTLFIAMQYMGMAIRKLPYMGVGRNLAYRKNVFFRNKGFGPHNHIMSGDDDLFVNLNATARNTKTEFREGSHTRSVPALTIAGWVRQKQRHLTTAVHYKPLHKIILLLEPSSRITFYSLLILLLSSLYLWPVLASVAGARLILQIVSFEITRRKFNEDKILLPSIIFDIFSPLINLFLYLTTLGNRSVKLLWR